MIFESRQSAASAEPHFSEATLRLADSLGLRAEALVVSSFFHLSFNGYQVERLLGSDLSRAHVCFLGIQLSIQEFAFSATEQYCMAACALGQPRPKLMPVQTRARMLKIG